MADKERFAEQAMEHMPSLYSAALSIAEERLGPRSRVDSYLYPRLAALRELQHRPAEAAEFRNKAGAKVRSLAY